MKARARTLCRCLTACALAGCAEPSFVSLGSNLSEQTSSESDAAAPTGPILLADDAATPFTAPDVPPPICAGAGSISVDGDCATRLRVECAPPNAFVPYPLSSLLTTLLRSCGAHQNRISVRFSQGCATSYDLSLPYDAAAAACITERLAAETYSCAEGLSCEAAETFGIPTSSVEPDWY